MWEHRLFEINWLPLGFARPRVCEFACGQGRLFESSRLRPSKKGSSFGLGVEWRAVCSGPCAECIPSSLATWRGTSLAGPPWYSGEHGPEFAKGHPASPPPFWWHEGLAVPIMFKDTDVEAQVPAASPARPCVLRCTTR